MKALLIHNRAIGKFVEADFENRWRTLAEHDKPILEKGRFDKNQEDKLFRDVEDLKTLKEKEMEIQKAA